MHLKKEEDNKENCFFALGFLDPYSIVKSFVLSMSNGLTSEQDLEDVRNF